MTTFITTTYIIFVKTQILSSTGIDFGTFMVAPVSWLFEQAPEFRRRHRQKWVKTQAKDGMDHFALPVFTEGKKNLVRTLDADVFKEEALEKRIYIDFANYF